MDPTAAKLQCLLRHTLAPVFLSPQRVFMRGFQVVLTCTEVDVYLYACRWHKLTLSLFSMYVAPLAVGPVINSCF